MVEHLLGEPFSVPVSGTLVVLVTWGGWLTALGLRLDDHLRHRSVLRALAARGDLPADLPGFLDHADGHVLLRRTGGGYAFAHRAFLDHFAEKGPAAPVREALPV